MNLGFRLYLCYNSFMIDTAEELINFSNNIKFKVSEYMFKHTQSESLLKTTRKIEKYILKMNENNVAI